MLGLRGELHITSPSGPAERRRQPARGEGHLPGATGRSSASTAASSSSSGRSRTRASTSRRTAAEPRRAGRRPGRRPALSPRVRLLSEPDMAGHRQAELAAARPWPARRAPAAPTRRCCSGPRSPCSPARARGRPEPGHPCSRPSTRSRSGSRPKATPSETTRQGRQAASKDWHIGYERGLNATAGSWQLIYRLARQLTVRAQAGGDNSLDPDLDPALEVAARPGGPADQAPRPRSAFSMWFCRKASTAAAASRWVGRSRTRLRGCCRRRTRRESGWWLPRPRSRRGSAPPDRSRPAHAFPRLCAMATLAASDRSGGRAAPANPANPERAAARRVPAGGRALSCPQSARQTTL